MNQNDEEYDNAFDMHIHNIDNILGKVNWYYLTKNAYVNWISIT